MKKIMCLLLLTSLLLTFLPAASAQTPVHFANGIEPAISGNDAYVVYEGELWRVNYVTGEQTKLTSNPILVEHQLDVSGNLLTYMRSDVDTIKTYDISTGVFSDLYPAAAGNLRYPRVSVFEGNTKLVFINRIATPARWTYRLYTILNGGTPVKVADRTGTGIEPNTFGFRAAAEGNTIIFLWRQTNIYGLKEYNIWKTTDDGVTKRKLLTLNARRTTKRIVDVNFSGNNLIYVYFDGRYFNLRKMDLTNDSITTLVRTNRQMPWIDIDGQTVVYTQKDRVYRLTF